MQPEIRDQILRRMDAFDGSIGRLGPIIDELDAIWGAEDWQPTDADSMRRSWGILEEIYALVLDRGDLSLKQRDQDDIAKALAAIRPIIQKGP